MNINENYSRNINLWKQAEVAKVKIRSLYRSRRLFQFLAVAIVTCVSSEGENVEFDFSFRAHML